MAYATLCRGCALPFETHQRTRVYCSGDCRIYVRLAKRGHCWVCKVKHEWYGAIPIDMGNVFAGEHLACRAKERIERDTPIVCGCNRCRNASDAPRWRRDPKLPPKKRRPTGYQKHRPTVLKRDDYICHLCRLPTDPNANPLDDTYPVLDHDDPQADGGSDEIDNLQTAHRWCNWVKLDGALVGEAFIPAAQERLRPVLEGAGILGPV